jgi:hypothetical protein
VVVGDEESLMRGSRITASWRSEEVALFVRDFRQVADKMRDCAERYGLVYDVARGDPK